MKLFKLIPIILIIFGIHPLTTSLLAESRNSQDYKVLSKENENLSVKNVEQLLLEGDSFIKKGKFDKAKESYDKARNLAKQLSNFYRDLNGAFRGLDARIPREMDDKGRNALKSWAESNLRLAALFKRKDQPEVAVPLLIEIIRLMTPSSAEGKTAYNELIKLGFVETPFKGF